MLFQPLLPIRCYRVECRFTQATALPFFHQAQLTGFLRNLLKFAQAQKNDLQRDQSFFQLTTHCPESGKTRYNIDDHYVFYVYQFGNDLSQITLLFDVLDALPDLVKQTECKGAFNDNLELVNIKDALSDQLLVYPEAACTVDEASLQAQVEALKQYSPDTLTLRFHSPVRLKKVNPNKSVKRRQTPFCQRADDVSPETLFDRLFDAASSLQQHLAPEEPRLTRSPAPSARFLQRDLFWADVSYKNANSADNKDISGLLGTLVLELPELTDLQWQTLVLGQYLGIGENRRFGCGRYHLLTEEGDSLIPAAERACPLLSDMLQINNLEKSWRLEQDKQPELSSFMPFDSLYDLRQRCLHADYYPKPLFPKLLEKPGKKERLLFLPNAEDKVLHKALSMWLSHSLDQLYSENSFGYRKGHSRLGARDQIGLLIRQGYDYALDADIEDFFESVEIERVLNRLTCLYGDDPAWHILQRILHCPIEHDALPEGYQDHQPKGLYLGNAISPVLANLMLDHLDSVLQDLDYKIVRFADDFLVLCKQEAQAHQAKTLITDILAEHGLTLNEEKTQVRRFSNGIRFLGYFFLNDTVVAEAPSTSDDQHFIELSPPRHKTPSLSSHSLFYQENPHKSVCLCGDIAHISLANKRLVIEQSEKASTEIPLSHIDSLILFGPHQITTQALTAAMQRGICIHYATGFGRYQGCASHLPDTPVFHLQQAAHFSQNEHSLQFAVMLTTARIRSQKELLRQRKATAPLLDNTLNELQHIQSLDKCFGLEGSAARAFWQQFKQLLGSEWQFEKRVKRPATDPINSLLSYGYSLLYSHMDSLLRSENFFPTLGGYHHTRGTHSALASDMMEPFRYLIERAVLTVVNTRQVKPDQFYMKKGQCWMNKDIRKFWTRYLIEQLQKPQFSTPNGHKHSALDQMLQQSHNLKSWIKGEAAHFAPWTPR